MLRQKSAQDSMDWLLRTMNRMLHCYDVDMLVDLAYDAIRDDLGYDRVGLLLVDHTRRTLVERVGTDAYGQKFYPAGRVARLDDGGYYARLLAAPRLQADGPGFIYMNDAMSEVPPDVRPRLDGHPGQTLRVSLRTNDGILALISVDNLTSGRPITPMDAPPLVTFTTALATAVENVFLLDERARRIDDLDANLHRRVHELTQAQTELGRRVGELEWLRDISQRVNAADSLDTVLDVVYDGIRDGLGYDRVGIHLLDRARGVYEECRGTDAQGRKFHPENRPLLPLTEDSPIWQVPDLAALLRGAEYYYLADAVAETPPAQRYLLDGSPSQNLVVPLRTADTLTGVISVDNLLSGRPIHPDDAGPLCALANHVGTAIENARLHEHERTERARLEIMAMTDALTGLPNRRLFFDRLDQALRIAQRDHSHIALLLIDLDRFKDINDTLGHHTGDLLLQEVGARLQSTVRQSDTVARLGGDEFAALLPATSMAGARRTVRAILAHIQEAMTLDGRDVTIEASIGIAVYPDHGIDTQTLLRHADAAMYSAKHSRSGHAPSTPEPDRL